MPNQPAEPQRPRQLDASLVYSALRDDIILGRLSPSERLVIADLALRYGTSTNPVREALQQLRGEGLVVFSHNRGARVRAIDEDFVRDIYEVAEMLEAHMARAFVPLATEEDVARLRAVQDEYEAINFTDRGRVAELDYAFHSSIYERQHNRLALATWNKQRDTLASINRGFPVSLSRRGAIIEQHRGIIAAIAAQDAEAAAEITSRHVRGAGAHFVEQMRAARRDASA